MGRELFDYAFKTYCERWAFKHPTPADFFRTMEDASAVDLDWFWRGWFYSTDHVDISLDQVKWFQLNTMNPTIEKTFNKEQSEKADQNISIIRNKESIKETINEKDPAIDDYYAKRDIYLVDALDKKEYDEFMNTLSEEDKKLLSSNKQFYELTFSNLGGLVMPLIIQVNYADQTSEVIRIPAEIWKTYENRVSKVLILDKEVESFRLDPFLETADTDLNNNSWPQQQVPTRYELFKQKQSRENPMQRQKRVDELNGQ
jgi:hypothetical protein